MDWSGGSLKESNKFIAMLILQAAKTVEGVLYLESTIDRVDARSVESLRALAEDASELRRVLIDELHKTFVTPLDREDIHQLVTRMDDILDLIEDCAQSISLYDVRAPTPEMKRLAEICVGCAEKVQAGVGGLSDLRDARAILAACADIDKLESEADHVMRTAIGKLFREEPDAKEIIKLRSIYELLETITDRCEDVANIVEGIVLEHS